MMDRNVVDNKHKRKKDMNITRHTVKTIREALEYLPGDWPVLVAERNGDYSESYSSLWEAEVHKFDEEAEKIVRSADVRHHPNQETLINAVVLFPW